MRKCLVIVYALNIIRIIWLVTVVKQASPSHITDYSVQLASITIFCIIAYLGIKDIAQILLQTAEQVREYEQ